MIVDKAKELGKVPVKRDMGVYGDRIATRFGTWNTALQKAGFKVNEKKGYTKEELIKSIRDRAEELGRVPRLDDMQHGTAIKRAFGSWNNALKYVDLSNIHLKIEKERIDAINKERALLVKEIQDKYKEIGYVPKEKNFRRVKRFYDVFGSFSNAVRSAGYIPNSYKTEEELLLILKQHIELANGDVSIDKLEKTGLSISNYINVFGSFGNALKALEYNVNAGFSEYREFNDCFLMDAYIKLSNKVGRFATTLDIRSNKEMREQGISDKILASRFGTLTALKEKIYDHPELKIDRRIMRKHIKYTDEELKECMINIYKEHGRISIKKLIIILKENDGPSVSTVLNRFKIRYCELWDKIEREINNGKY